MDDAGVDGASRVRVRVPSKVNLFLGVRGLRPDGYHELVTVMQTVTIHDTVLAKLDGSVASAHPAARRFMELAFTQEAGPGVPPGGDNLAVRAARHLMGLVGVGTSQRDAEAQVPVTRLHLTKNIPVAAGMAGGSADAAAALLALNRLWGTGLDRDELREIAAELGADVPFCVTGGTALATGTGTATAQVLCRGTYYWVVGISDQPLSTPAVYRAYDDVGTPSEREPDAVLQALRTGDAEALGAALHNDLEVAAFSLRPELHDARDMFLDNGALGAVVSGSGPTVVALAESAQHAGELARRMHGVFDRIEVALSPAGGPDIESE
ncbi:MAG: 4-(cytidine 5'-diphospho)-2-C-methyl-D-erythritol kinase [Egicoccus sp.]